VTCASPAMVFFAVVMTRKMVVRGCFAFPAGAVSGAICSEDELMVVQRNGRE